MPLKPPQIIVLKCSVCGNMHVLRDILDECEEWREERPMGQGVTHVFHGSMTCLECDNEMSYSLIESEYPQGSVEFVEPGKTVGCEVYKYSEVEPEFIDLGDLSEAAWRQVEEAREVARRGFEESLVRNGSGRDFEMLVAELLRAEGFPSVEVTPQTRDGGKDIVVAKLVDGKRVVLYVECKHYAEGNNVGVGVVRSLHGVRTAYGADAAMIVTSSRFSRDAREFADRDNVKIALMDFGTLVAEIDRMLAGTAGDVGRGWMP